MLRFSGGTEGRSHMAHCVGFSVAALMALISAVAAMTRANWANILPVRPGTKAAGMNTDISTSVMPMTGPNSSFIALIAASWLDMPRSMWRATPSTITMASSTTMPIASTMPNIVVVLMVKPIAAMAAKAPMMVTGIVVAGTSMARQSCRKITITISTRTPASSKVLKTSLIDAVTKRVVSNGTS